MRCSFDISNARIRTAQRGFAALYLIVVMGVMLGMATFTVDYGRVRLAKSQLRECADSAARYAVAGMVNSSTPATTATNHARAVLTESRIEGRAIDNTGLTTTIGVWNTQTRTFTATTTSPNAVKVDLIYNYGTAGGVRLFSAAVTSYRPVVRASAIAMAVTQETEFLPPASGNLWLSDMGAGTMNQNFRPDANWVWDYAGDSNNARQNPLESNLSTLNVQPGDALTFEGLSGTATYVANSSANSADGQSNFIVALGQTRPSSVPNNSMNGMSNLRSPIGAVIAVFLSDDKPNLTGAPANLDFNNATQRDYTTLSPQLKQTFFVGDGKRANGEIQNIIVPPGATRVFMGMMDAWQWNDNVGNFKFKVYARRTVSLVQ